MDHFIYWDSYEDKLEVNWKDIYEENVDKQFMIGQFILHRYRKRETKIKQQADILKVDFFTRSKLQFWNFAQEIVLKITSKIT